MSKETIEVCYASEAMQKIQPFLDRGWKVKSMVAENVSVSVSLTGSDRWIERRGELSGKIVFILYNEETK